MILWSQDAVCWKCRDRLECPLDGSRLWDWPKSRKVRVFWIKHRACDDGKSVGLELSMVDTDWPVEMFETRKVV